MRLLLTGASGQLGAYLLRQLRADGGEVVAWSGHDAGERFGTRLLPVDLADPDAVAAAFRAARPDVVLHAGAMARVAGCHRDPALARRVNTEATALLAELAAAAGGGLVFVSTDMVFDGERAPYREEDESAPLSVYGRTKADAEGAVRAAGGLVVRVSLLYGPGLSGRPSFFDEQTAALRSGRPLTLFEDEWRTPLALPAAAQALVGLTRSGVTGTLHVGGPERLSRLEMGLRLAEALGVPPTAVMAGKRDAAPGAESRPRDLSLDSTRWRGLFPHAPWPGWAEVLAGMGP
jgi:dTDP-4-dehydrorhamnose reductase